MYSRYAPNEQGSYVRTVVSTEHPRDASGTGPIPVREQAAESGRSSVSRQGPGPPPPAPGDQPLRHPNPRPSGPEPRRPPAPAVGGPRLPFLGSLLGQTDPEDLLILAVLALVLRGDGSDWLTVAIASALYLLLK